MHLTHCTDALPYGQLLLSSAYGGVRYTTYMKRRIAVRAIIVRDDQLLCVRLKKYEDKSTGDDNDYWCTPGGGVEEGEALIPALEREIIEELGPKPEVGNLLFIQQFIHADTEHLEFFFNILNADDYMDIDLDQTTHGAIEIEAVQFVSPKQEHVLPRFLTTESLIATSVTRIYDYIA